MGKKKFVVIIENDGKYYIAYIPSLPGCHTYAKTINKLMKYIKKAARLCLDTGTEVRKTDFVGVYTIEV
ncbi:MAG: type II toxin-antitoxin system HicB family antitoxin [Candidatus Aenigmarchaeota archaeon]|nr:type II toxin-antitoxin system HicB family antitoxin [Candidatus Aenigmarchaeota archaeon]